IRLLPNALAHVVAYGVAEHAGEGIGLTQVLGLFADDDDEFAFVLHLARIARNDDRLLVGDQRIDGTIANVGLLGQRRLDPLLGRHLANVLGIVEADAIERGRHDRHLELDRFELAGRPRALIADEGVARHLGDAVAFEDAIAGAAPMRIPDPTHALLLAQRIVVMGSTAAAGLASPVSHGARTCSKDSRRGGDRLALQEDRPWPTRPAMRARKALPSARPSGPTPRGASHRPRPSTHPNCKHAL